MDRRIIPAGVPFTQIANEAIQDPELTASAFRIYCYLMRRANTEGRAWPSVRTIAAEVHVNKSTVTAAVRQLKKRGWLEVHEGQSEKHRQKHIYTLHGTRSEAEQNRPDESDGSRDDEAASSVRMDQTDTVRIEDRDRPDDPDRSTSIDLHPEKNTQLAARTPKQRIHDEIVFALLEVCEMDRGEMTQVEWGRVHAAAKQLTTVGADAAEVHRRAKVYRLRYSGASMTPTAISSNWSGLSHVPVGPSRRDVDRMATRARAREAIRNMEPGS